MAYLYRHIRLDTNQVFYIGISSTNNYKRAKTEVSRNKFWKNVVNKTDWYSEIIIDDISFDLAKKKETEFILLYGRADLGLGTLVNLNNGGDGQKGYKVTDKVKRVLSEKNKGKKLSLDHRAKISKSHKGKVFSPETIEKMREVKKGKKQSLEQINKRRIKLFGNKSNLGRKLPEEQKAKMRESQKRRRLIEKQKRCIKDDKR